MASDGSETVPKRLATDLFLGALPSALNEELLRMLCISHIIVFAPALDEPSTSSDGGFSVEAAINTSKKLNTTLLRLVGATDAVSSERTDELLSEACDLLVYGRAKGGVLLAGPLDEQTRLGPAWIASAFLVAQNKGLSISKAFLACRNLHPTARLSATLATAAEGFAKKWQSAAEARARQRSRGRSTSIGRSTDDDGNDSGGEEQRRPAPSQAASLPSPLDTDLRAVGHKAVLPTAADATRRLQLEVKRTEKREAAQRAAEEPQRRAARLIENGSGAFTRLLWRRSDGGGASSSVDADEVQEEEDALNETARPRRVSDTLLRPTPSRRPAVQPGPPPGLQMQALSIGQPSSEPPPMTAVERARQRAKARAAEAEAKAKAAAEALAAAQAEAAAAMAEAEALAEAEEEEAADVSDAPTIALPPPPPPPGLASPSTPATPASSWYRCRKCRTQLFTADMLGTHEPGNGQMAFKARKRGSCSSSGTEMCTSHFLLQDAQSALHAALNAEGAGDEGDLGCPKCKVRLGGYSWYGMQCACGAWVCPAIQVVKSKVDEAAPRVPIAQPSQPAQQAPRGPRDWGALRSA